MSLDFRVTTLEENEGSDGNSSVAELEVRVETLEAADHETRIAAAEINIKGKAFLNLDIFLSSFFLYKSNIILF